MTRKREETNPREKAKRIKMREKPRDRDMRET
jgi:hypothetical protein